MPLFSKKTDQKIWGYLKGWFVTSLFTLAFAAVGWIEITSDMPFARLFVPFVTGLVVWTMIYISCVVIWVAVAFAAAISSMIFGVAGFFVLVFVGWLCLKFAQYTSGDMIAFSNNNWLFLFMGAIYSLIIFIDPHKRQQVGRAFS